MDNAGYIIKKLKLQPHPEGGHFRETFRDQTGEGRAVSTAIYYLLREGEVSHWHRVDAAEVWHWYAGAAMEVKLSEKKGQVKTHILGPALAAGERPQLIVPKMVWQSARSLGPWTLIGCTVAPGFEFEGFEMAPKGWQP